MIARPPNPAGRRPLLHLSLTARSLGIAALGLVLTNCCATIDHDPPTINATATPGPNANGWHNSDVVVAFDCQDDISEVVDCPPPVVVSTEDADQTITGTATDITGNSAAVSVTINLDKTDPMIVATVTPAPNDSGWNNTNPTVAFAATDSLSGIDRVTAPALVSSEGKHQAIKGTATDRAGNSATTSVTVRLDKTAPHVSILSPENETTLNNSSANIAGTLTDALSGVARVSCNGTPASHSHSAFDCTVPLTEGANVIVVEAIDIAGNSRSSSINVAFDPSDISPPTVTAAADITVAAVDGSGILAVEESIATFLQQASAVSGTGEPLPVSNDAPPLFPLGDTLVTFTAEDTAGQFGEAAAMVHVEDLTPPHLVGPSPLELVSSNGSPVATANQALSGWLQSASATDNVDPDIEVLDDAPPFFPVGLTTVTFTAVDSAGNLDTLSSSVVVKEPPPHLEILEPVAGMVQNGAQVDVTGAIESDVVSVSVNGQPATVSDSGFSLIGLPLHEGDNEIRAVAFNAAGDFAIDRITVTLDTTPPVITVDLPEDTASAVGSAIDVAGSVFDPGLGPAQDGEVSVEVYGVPAQVTNGMFVAYSVPIQLGENFLEIEAIDRAGNQAARDLTVIGVTQRGNRLTTVSGNNQTGLAGETVATALKVQLSTKDGNRLAGRRVDFQVTRGDGVLRPGTDAARRVTVLTDASGQAMAQLRLGTRAGPCTTRVEVSSIGADAPVIFCANVLPAAGRSIAAFGSNHFTGLVNRPLPKSAEVIVRDEHGNPISNEAVIFEIEAGLGSFDGATSLTVNSDSRGLAAALPTLGPFTGAVHRFTASLTNGDSATFTASGVRADPSGETSVVGLVLDNTDLPVPGVTVSLSNTSLSATTSDDGRFAIVNAPAGPMELLVDGTTTTRPGVWPILSFHLESFQGVDNDIGMPVRLLPIAGADTEIVGGDRNVVLQMDSVPGLEIKVLAHSVTCPDGSTECAASITQVNRDRVPMPPIAGASPRLVWTVQPPGIRFDPPAEVTYPNFEGLSPGRVVEIFSFDHDVGQFVSIGTAAVSEDGSVIVSDPGFGIAKAGWGYSGGGGGPRTGGGGGGGDDDLPGWLEDLAKKYNKPAFCEAKFGSSCRAGCGATVDLESPTALGECFQRCTLDNLDCLR